ncbi:MAG: 2-amino-4-hydroxy-6-hydroxymethyldihydropteridine diphosphokinase [Prevotella sp.]|nr:2-amino-4-hydroxy-6-hydroxymethyldihydropteridine diphosphokinase [Prevotella sp.]
MHHVLILLASNYEHEKNLWNARLALAQILSSAVYTDAIWTEPEGTSHVRSYSQKYLNQLVRAETPLDIDQLTAQLKETETRMGRTADMRKAGIVPIDLDVLEYDGTRHHLRDWQRSYVRKLIHGCNRP